MNKMLNATLFGNPCQISGNGRMDLFEAVVGSRQGAVRSSGGDQMLRFVMLTN
jgi:hypothetical protein